MRDREIKIIPVHEGALTVDVSEDEIVVGGFSAQTPTLTIASARETARRLIAAAEQVEAQRLIVIS